MIALAMLHQGTEESAQRTSGAAFTPPWLGSTFAYFVCIGTTALTQKFTRSPANSYGKQRGTPFPEK